MLFMKEATLFITKRLWHLGLMNCCNLACPWHYYYLEYFAELHDDPHTTQMGRSWRRPILTIFWAVATELQHVVIHIHILTKNNCWTRAILLLSSVIVACYKFVAPLQTWTECYFSSDSQLKMVVSNCLHQSGCDCTGNEILASYKWTQSWVILWPGFTTLKLSHLWLNCLFFPFISFSLRLGFKRAAHSLKLSASVRGLLIGTSFFLIAHKLKQLWGKLWIPQVSRIVGRFVVDS